jgi:predicted glycoside hydrolase/deacetylase ChbG (UPF0249 family)
VPSLIGPDGKFLAPGEFRQRWLLKKIDKSEIIQELRAQYRRFTEVAGSGDFWNTHQNVHVFPGLFQLFVEQGKHLGIRAMRSHRRLTIPNNQTPVIYNFKNPTYWLKGLVISGWSRTAKNHGTAMPDGRLYTPGYKGQSVSSLDEIVSRLQWNSIRNAVELVVHPAVSVENDLFGGLTETRLLEYHALSDPGLVLRLNQQSVTLTGFESVH